MREARGRGAKLPLLALSLAIALSACATARPVPPGTIVEVRAVEPEREWVGIVQPADLDRLQRLNAAWTQALAIPGVARSVRAEGALLDPRSRQPRAELPPGSYHCRHIRIAPAARGRRAFTASPRTFCYVGADGEKLAFTRQTGAERPGGYLYSDGLQRQVFIGALARGREGVPPAYTANPQRDVVGVVERVDSFRYRLVIPWPRSGATLEIYELIPAVR